MTDGQQTIASIIFTNTEHYSTSRTMLQVQSLDEWRQLNCNITHNYQLYKTNELDIAAYSFFSHLM